MTAKMARDTDHAASAQRPLRALHGFVCEQGGIVPQDGGAAFTLLRPVNASVPVLISVPHAGRRYPAAILQQMRRPTTDALMLEDRLIDTVAQEIAQTTGATLLLAEAPRAMIDLNRSPDDVDWEMVERGKKAPLHSARNHRARSGLGLVPRRLARTGEIWTTRLSAEELAVRVAQIHAPYHTMLGRLLADMHTGWGAALLIDLHSMPPLGRQSGQLAPAGYVLGDRFGASCAAAISSFALQQLGKFRRVAHNLPYAGGYVLDRHGQPRRNIHALQLEVCRSLYLDASLTNLGARHAAVARELAAVISALASEVEWLGRSQLQAAE